MNLYQVKNNFANYRLQKYLVVAKNEESAVNVASKKLKIYALNSKYSFDIKTYENLGLSAINIFDHIEDVNFTDYFTATCLIADIQEGSIVRNYSMF